MPSPIPLTARFREALSYAAELHQNQARKGTTVPYVTHLLSVCALVLEDGGDEDEAIAALLHDAVEDQGGPPTLEEIRRSFGDRVAVIVEACTDSDRVPKPPWRLRKEAHLARLRAADASVRRVTLADKVHNARSLLANYREAGEAIWARFSGGREGSLWYYQAVVDIFRAVGPAPLLDELVRTLHELDHLMAATASTHRS